MVISHAHFSDGGGDIFYLQIEGAAVQAVL